MCSLPGDHNIFLACLSLTVQSHWFSVTFVFQGTEAQKIQVSMTCPGTNQQQNHTRTYVFLCVIGTALLFCITYFPSLPKSLPPNSVKSREGFLPDPGPNSSKFYSHFIFTGDLFLISSFCCISKSQPRLHILFWIFNYVFERVRDLQKEIIYPLFYSSNDYNELESRS